MDEAAAKDRMAAAGLTVPRRIEAADAQALATLDLPFPVALKALGIAHKTEAGAVALDLETQDEVIRAAATMPANGGFLVEEMVTGGIAELIVGVVAVGIVIGGCVGAWRIFSRSIRRIGGVGPCRILWAIFFGGRVIGF